eukprot:CAMPEP_0119555264 /NCGR_PEP_ID=MMETSP1352-20130426/7542_1 /TAXON_ID=265584 /ORGANISM="Stauroneis constricta, Strain CCMP1120" /LENGTH=253 /DNA_ID=CAMNT_0007602005 /DNA_START=15 /DNA_END=776 /DNA_ORIENTATION=+
MRLNSCPCDGSNSAAASYSSSPLPPSRALGRDQGTNREERAVANSSVMALVGRRSTNEHVRSAVPPHSNEHRHLHTSSLVQLLLDGARMTGSTNATAAAAAAAATTMSSATTTATAAEEEATMPRVADIFPRDRSESGQQQRQSTAAWFLSGHGIPTTTMRTVAILPSHADNATTIRNQVEARGRTKSDQGRQMLLGVLEEVAAILDDEGDNDDELQHSWFEDRRGGRGSRSRSSSATGALAVAPSRKRGREE